MNPYLKDISTIVRQVHIENEHHYHIAGKAFTVAHQQAYQRWHQPLSSFGENPGEENGMRANLQNWLAASLYDCFYSVGVTERKTGEEPMPPPPPISTRQKTIQKLSEANQSVNRLDRYWNVYSIDTYGNTYISKNGNLRFLAPNEWEFANNTETSLKTGSSVHLKIQKEDTSVQPTFYHVRSNELVSQQAEFTRIYFHTGFEGALSLVHEITLLFNRYQVPFLFKCLNQPELFTRADSAVLYLDKTDFHFGSRLLRRILPTLRPYLKPEIPLFTRLLLPGVSFSEDPGNGQSFGMSRCTFLAEGLVNAFFKELNTPERKEAEVEKLLSKNGIDIEKIYMKPNSKFPYDFSVFDNL